MKLSPFTLVYKPYEKSQESAEGSNSSSSPTKTRVRYLLEESSSEAKRNLLKASVQFLSLNAESDDDEAGERMSAFETLAADLGKSSNVVTVGLWDLGTRAGNLPKIVSRLNEGQKTFTFYDLQAPVPAGLISRRERILSWAEKHGGRKPQKINFAAHETNVIADDFFDYARQIRHYFNLAYVVGIVPQRITNLEVDNHVAVNRYAASSGRAGKGRYCLLSAYNLRRQAKETERNFEASVALLVVCQMLIALSKTLTYDSPKNCIFNCVANEPKRVAALKEFEIGADCLNQVSPLYQQSAGDLMRILREYERI
jgi:hypothetical protein